MACAWRECQADDEEAVLLQIDGGLTVVMSCCAVKCTLNNAQCASIAYEKAILDDENATNVDHW